MKIKTELYNSRIKISEPSVADTYYIEQADNNRFHITSENGYSSYETAGYKELEQAIKHAKKMIKNYFLDRGEEPPAGFLKRIMR
ncbi:MAG: hypothetical protein UT21_C0006G0010 [Candidatus Woesebacteria bacterium GW2011_GWA1_39_11b]|nr:MAG: hypothetical protein UT21_C0006G0010 [Candidatus Woesebacteria bacterium GW2011_GWA1_39_11b]